MGKAGLLHHEKYNYYTYKGYEGDEPVNTFVKLWRDEIRLG